MSLDPCTHADEIIRYLGPIGPCGPVLSLADAALIRQGIAKALDMRHEDLAVKLSEAAEAVLIDRAMQDTKQSDTWKSNAYNQVGHVCPVTGRLAMTVAQAYARDDSCNRTFFAYDLDSAEAGLDGWRLIEGIDASKMAHPDGSPVDYTLDWAGGGSKKVYPHAIVYMQRKRSEFESQC